MQKIADALSEITGSKIEFRVDVTHLGHVVAGNELYRLYKDGVGMNILFSPQMEPNNLDDVEKLIKMMLSNLGYTLND